MIQTNAFDYINVLNRAADAAWQRNEAISNNIANVDTPGYRRKRVNFEETFRRKLEAAALTGKNEDVRQAIQSSKSYVVEDAHTTRADGNGGNADVEDTELTRTALQYQYLTQSLSGDIVRYRSAIKGQ